MRCRTLREWIVTWGLVGFSLVVSPFSLAAPLESAALPPDRVDALTASVALYPDPLLAKLLIAATYPLEVDEAELWLRKHNFATGAVLDRAIASQRWDDSIKDLARVPAVLSMMDARLEWTQNLGDAFLAQPGDVFASFQRLRRMALRTRTLHSTSQQKVTDGREGIIIEPAIAQVIEVPFYDPQVAYGVWPHPMYPPMWWTAPPGYVYGSGIAFMTGVGVPAAFWKDAVNWDAGKLMVHSAVAFNDHYRVTGTPWIHDPEHRRFVSYSTPQLRLRYGRDFASVEEPGQSLRGYDSKPDQIADERLPGHVSQTHKSSNDAKLKPRTSIFENIDQGARERSFSRRGNASIFAARHDNAHFAIGELAAAAAETDTVAAR